MSMSKSGIEWRLFIADQPSNKRAWCGLAMMQNYLRFAILVSLTVLTLLGTGKSQSNETRQARLIEGDKNQAAKDGHYSDAIYSFAIGRMSYRITGEGELSVLSLRSQRTVARIPLDFPKPAYISGIRYLAVKSDLILCYDVLLVRRPIRNGDKVVEGDVLQRRVARFHGPSLKTKWVAISALTEPASQIVAGNSMFVTGVGMIGEIDLERGLYLWRHENLQERNPGKFVIFKLPRAEGGFVYFEEDPAFLSSRATEIIQVKRRTGEIVTMSYKSPRD